MNLSRLALPVGRQIKSSKVLQGIGVRLFGSGMNVKSQIWSDRAREGFESCVGK